MWSNTRERQGEGGGAHGFVCIRNQYQTRPPHVDNLTAVQLITCGQILQRDRGRGGAHGLVCIRNQYQTRPPHVDNLIAVQLITSGQIIQGQGRYSSRAVLKNPTERNWAGPGLASQLDPTQPKSIDGKTKISDQKPCKNQRLGKLMFCAFI